MRTATSRWAAAGLAVIATTVTAAPATAAAVPCRESSFIPTSSFFVLQSRDGRHVIHLQKAVQSRQHYIKAWYNGRYLGADPIPVALLPGGELTALIRTRTGTEIWMGQVRQTTKQVAVLRLCGSNWIPVVFR